MDMHRACQALGALGFTRILVEGGGILHAALFSAGVADELHWITAPMILGGDAISAIGPLGFTLLDQAPRFALHQRHFFGKDLAQVFRIPGKTFC
jgi:diaminohydroxyphosphoribosylaminopyrimidine deaminase/5-amino-6-(5-phosphoribosylamino)uracil reductase